jgi:3'(2'), 5'-bisphosphate nucleotidase
MSRQHDQLMAYSIAVEASQRLLRLRAEQGPKLDDPQSIKAFAQLADRTSNAWIIARIREEFPGDAILSEESDDDLARLQADRCWIIDPVDGTWEYSHHRNDFAVHIALWERGRELTVGTVAVPANGEYWSTHERGTRSRRSTLPTDRNVRIVVSRTRPLKDESDFVLRLAEALAPARVPGVTLVRVGSVGAKVGEVLAGRADAYVSESGFYEWDGAAPAVVAATAGLIVSKLDGSPHTYNNADVKMPGYVVAPSWLAQPLYSVLTAREARG